MKSLMTEILFVIATNPQAVLESWILFSWAVFAFKSNWLKSNLIIYSQAHPRKMSSTHWWLLHILEFSSFPVVCQAVIFISNPHIGSRTSGLSCHSPPPSIALPTSFSWNSSHPNPAPTLRLSACTLTLHPTLSWQQPLISICLYALFLCYR